MSFSEKEHIDDLFKGLQDERIEADAAQLLDMEKRLNKWRFYRFGWSHFNIYYSGLIALTGLTLLWVSLDFLYPKQTTPTVQRSPISTPDSAAPLMQPVAPINNTPSVEPVSPQKYNTTRTTVLAPDSLALKTKDSIIAPAVKENNWKTEASASPKKDSIVVPKVVKLKKTVYLSKRDTIVKYDTTKVLKKK